MTSRCAAAIVLLLSTVFGSAASATPYANGLTMTVGNLKLDFASCTVLSAGSAVPKSCASLNVLPLTLGNGSPTDPFLYGFSTNGFIGATGTGSETITLTYTADVLDPNFGISDMHLSQTGSASAGASVTDTYTSGANPEGVLSTNGLAPVASANALKIASIFDVTSIIAILPTNDVTVLEQLYSEDTGGSTQGGLPEPATIALFGAALALGGMMIPRLRSRRVGR